MASVQENLHRIKNHIAELCEQLDEWQAAIDEFRARAEERKVTSSGEYRLRELVLLREETDQRLAQIRQALNDALEDLEESVRDSWGEVRKEFKSAREKHN